MEAIFAGDASRTNQFLARDNFKDAARRRPDGDYLSFCVRPAPEFTCHASKATVPVERYRWTWLTKNALVDFSAVPAYTGPFLRTPFKPCVQFSCTRLNDDLTGVACAGYFTVPRN